MKKKIVITILISIYSIFSVSACTNFLVGKAASTDGSTLVTYSADSYWLYGALYHHPAASYPNKAKLDIYEWDTGKYLGKIDQARKTYNVIGNMNEHQLTIAETTFSGRPELVDSTGIIDYGNLIYITLQRAKTAREAIVKIVELTNKYGYYSSGESFSIADPNEIWIMEFIGKGPNEKGIVWVARRIPDDCVSGHANQARITTFPLENKNNKTSISSKHIKKIFNPEITTIYSDDVIKFARKKGYFKGKDSEFNFSDAYNPLDFTGIRCCEARVWSFFRIANPEMDKYLSYIDGKTKERMPLWIKPTHKLSVQDMKLAMRNHYEDTPLDMSKGMGSGNFKSVYRLTPLIYEYNGKEYFHERPVATQQTGFTFVAQMRNYLPNYIGGLLWFGVDDATCNIYVPIYACSTEVPESLSEQNGNMLEFNWNSAFWVNNWVAQMVYERYSWLFPDVKNAQTKLESQFDIDVAEAEKYALSLSKEQPIHIVIQYLTQFSKIEAETAINTWKKLGEYLLVKYLDGTIKNEKNGKFDGNEKNIPNNLQRPGYNNDYIEKELIKPNPERFRLKTKEELNQRI